MKRIKTSILPILLGIFTIGIFAACSPDTPEDEGKNKLHEDPTKAVFTLVEGKLKAGKAFDAMPHEEDFEATGKTQTIVWEVIKGEHFKTSNVGQDRFYVKSIKQNPDLVYSLKIDYYNREGKIMNNQFFDNEQDRIHQHFFEYFENGARIGKKENLPYDYTYADTYNGKFIGATNPMGFFGFMRFVQSNKNFNLKVELMHAGRSSKFNQDGSVSPFYKPSKEQKGLALWDLSVTLPIEIAE